MNDSILISNELKIHRTEAARFLEQTTFGPTLTGINALSETSRDGQSPDFASWIENQMDPTPSGAGMNAHREFYRSHTNPRFEYPFPGGGAGPNSACDVTSRWRKFALTERDGINSLMTNMDKYLYITRKNGRYIYHVEGMARTTSRDLGKILNIGGTLVRSLDLYPVMYEINTGEYFNDNMKYSCVGCPVRICNKLIPGFKCGKWAFCVQNIIGSC